MRATTSCSPTSRFPATVRCAVWRCSAGGRSANWTTGRCCSPRPRAPRAACATGVGVTECRSYLAGLDYALTDTHLAGLTDFFRRLAARGLVPDGSLQFLQVA